MSTTTLIAASGGSAGTATAPGRAQLLDYRGCLGTLKDASGRCVWTPALPGAPADVLTDWLSLLREAGATHVPIGPFGPGPSYPGIVHWDNPDWRNDPQAIRGLLDTLLTTDAGDGYGFRPVIFTDGGPPDPLPRLKQIFPVLAEALKGIDDHVIVLPAGWEPVVGAFTSFEVSWALEHWHALCHTLIGYHGSPARLVGSSNCNPEDTVHCTPGGYEPDDPWKGGESIFYEQHGGQFIDIALYQTPHGDEIYRPCVCPNAAEKFGHLDSCFLNRWEDYVSRIGAGYHGWRKLPLVAFEATTYEVTRGWKTAEDAKRVMAALMTVPAKWGITCGWGDGPPI